MLNILWFRLYPSDSIGVGIYLWPKRPILSLYETLIFMRYRDRLSVGIVCVDNPCSLWFFFLLSYFLYIRIPKKKKKKTCIHNTHTKKHTQLRASACAFMNENKDIFLLIKFNSTNCPLPSYPSIDRNKKKKKKNFNVRPFIRMCFRCIPLFVNTFRA